jgi:hypothetical protein
MAKFGFGKKIAQLFGLHKNTNQDFFDDLTDLKPTKETERITYIVRKK